MSHISKYGSFISRVVLLPFLLLSLSLIQACGLPGEAGGTSGESNDEIGSGTGQTATGVPDRFKGLILNVERLNGQTELSGSISFVALDESQRETDFSIPQYSIEYSKEAENTLLRINDTDYVENVNHVIKMTFGSGETYYSFIPPTETVDQDSKVIEQVTANIYSHYAVIKFIEKIGNSTELEKALPCSTGGGLINCINQPKAKQILMYNLANLAAGFDFDFGQNPTVATAIETLAANAEFNQLVEKSIDEVILTTAEAEAILLATSKENLNSSDVDPAPIARGTFRSTAIGTDLQGTQLNFNTTISETYNSVYFNIGVGAPVTDDLTIISATSSTIVNNGDTTVIPPSYSRYYKNNTMANMRYESALTADIQIEQQNLELGGLNDSTTGVEVNRNIPTNSISSSETFDSFITTQGNILDSRVYLQTLPPGSTTGDSGLEGLTLSPTYSKMYSVNDYEPPASITSIDSNEEAIDYGYEPTWLTSANLNQATKSQVDNYQLDNETVTDTEHNKLFSWEVHGLQTNTDFAISDLDGKQYGAISFGIKLNTTGKIVELIGDVMSWSASGRSISVSQPAIPSDFYMSHHLSLNQDGSVNTLSSDRNSILTTRLVNTQETVTANTDHSGGVTSANKGLMLLDQGSEAPIGHSTQSGDYLAFAFNTTDSEAVVDRGTGIILASAYSNSKLALGASQLIYQLQGNSISIKNGENIYRNWNGSTLEITGTADSCNATLHLESISVTQTIENEKSEVSSSVFESASSPLSTGKTYSHASTSCSLDGNAITMKFADVYNSGIEGDTSNYDLTLKGFVSSSGSDTDEATKGLFGNLLTLLWQQENTLGLVLGHKEQTICPHFDEQITTNDPRCSN